MTPREQMEAWQQAFDSGRHEAALPLIAALASAYPQEPALQFRHAQTLRELGRFEDALAALVRLLDLRPNLVPAWLQRAELESLLGDVDAAEDSLRRAVAVDPRHVDARLRLAAFLMERSEGRLAAYELEQVLTLDPDSLAAAALRERLAAVPTRPSAAPAPAAPTPSAPPSAVRLQIDALPLAAPAPAAPTAPQPIPMLPAEDLQAVVDAHWAGLRQDEDRLAATASLAALVLAWAPPPALVPSAEAVEASLGALGYRVLGRVRPAVSLPFAPPVRGQLLMSADGRVLALSSSLALPNASLLERWWLRLTGRWRRLDLLELCSELVDTEDAAATRAMVLSNNLGGQAPFEDPPPVYLQRYHPRARGKALDVLHRRRIERLREELGGRCLPLADAAAAESLMQRLHEQRRAGRLQLDLLLDDELQRFLGAHYPRVAGRVYRQLEALQRAVQDRLAAQASRASEPA